MGLRKLDQLREAADSYRPSKPPPAREFKFSKALDLLFGALLSSQGKTRRIQGLVCRLFLRSFSQTHRRLAFCLLLMCCIGKLLPNHEGSSQWGDYHVSGLHNLHPKCTNSRPFALALAAPFSSSSRTHSAWPLSAACMRAVQPQARQGPARAGKLPLSPSSSFSVYREHDPTKRHPEFDTKL